MVVMRKPVMNELALEAVLPRTHCKKNKEKTQKHEDKMLCQTPPITSRYSVSATSGAPPRCGASLPRWPKSELYELHWL